MVIVALKGIRFFECSVLALGPSNTKANETCLFVFSKSKA